MRGASMLRGVWIAGACLALTGCGLSAPDEQHLPPMPDPRCAAAARERAADAAINGYDESLQRRVARDSYAICMRDHAR